MSLHLHTPLLHSPALSATAGTRVMLKMEALQPSGSFKLRGVGLACEMHARRGVRRFVSSSGGNAGLAVAHAARQLGLPATVVVPITTSERARELLLQLGADLQVRGLSWDEAHAAAMAYASPMDAFIHPFDDPLLWRGHATLVDEVLSDGCRPDAVVLAVGGGGLLSGVVQGLQRHGLDEVPVFAVETEGAASLAAAVAAGRLVSLPSIASVATSLGARQVCEQALTVACTHPVTCVQVSDLSALAACRRFLHDHRVLVEPACGAALALAYEHADRLRTFERVLVVVCGGATASLDSIEALYRSAAERARPAMPTPVG